MTGRRPVTVEVMVGGVGLHWVVRVSGGESEKASTRHRPISTLLVGTHPPPSVLSSLSCELNINDVLCQSGRYLR